MYVVGERDDGSGHRQLIEKTDIEVAMKRHDKIGLRESRNGVRTRTERSQIERAWRVSCSQSSRGRKDMEN